MGGMGIGQMAGMGTGLSGDLISGIGNLIEAQNYQRPKLPPAVGPELRLRQLAQDQLLGGGQQLLGATALYNQLAPILMSQLPGMHYVPGTGGAGGTQTGGGAGSSPMASYSQALQNFQNQQGLKQKLIALNAQIKGMQPGQQRRDLRTQRKGIRQQVKQLPDAAALERQMYMAGSQPGSFDIRMSPGGDQNGAPPAPSSQSSLGDINSLMASLGAGRPDLSSIYQGQMNPTGGGGFL